MLEAASRRPANRNALAGFGGKIVRYVSVVTEHRDLVGCGLDFEGRVLLSDGVDKAVLDRSASLVGALRGYRFRRQTLIAVFCSCSFSVAEMTLNPSVRSAMPPGSTCAPDNFVQRTGKTESDQCS